MADFDEHKATVAKYSPKVNTVVLDNMLDTYAIVLNKADSQYVACSDDTEKDRVRENFLKKKLGLTNPDADLDKAIEEICQTMKDDRFKSRLAFYYLLAEKYNKLSVFA